MHSHRILLHIVFLVNPLARSQPCHILCSGSRWVIMVIDKLKGSIGLDSYSGKSSDSSTHPLFFPVPWHNADLAHHFHSPSHSQLLVEPRPSCPWSYSAEWMTRRCSEKHWTAQCGGASLKPCRFFSLRPALCKNPTTPSVTLPIPCAPSPLTRFHSGTQALSTLPCPLPLQRRDAGFPQFPDSTVSAFYFQRTMGGYVFSVQGSRTITVVDLVQMLFPGHMALVTQRLE